MAAEIDPDARERVLAALAGGVSVSEAARRSGYSRMHVNRLMKEPSFAAELERRRAEIAASPTSPDEDLALEVLREVAQSHEDPAIARVAAAKAILGHVTARAKKKPANAPPAPIVLRPAGGDAAARAWLDRTPG